jgi:Na+-driven multidrug efflux pump
MRSMQQHFLPLAGSVEPLLRDAPCRHSAAVWRIGCMNMAFTQVVSVVFFFLHDELIAMFSNDKAVIAIGGEWLSIL